MSLTSRIQALIDYANETTDAGDTLLGDAVKTLADGYHDGGETHEVKTIWDSADLNGDTKTQWNDISLWSSVQIPSTTDTGLDGTAAGKVTAGTTIKSATTILLPIQSLPRYVAITVFSVSGSAFPVAHITRSRTSGGEGVRYYKALRNISSDIKHIFDLEDLVNTYYEPLDGYSPYLAIRTNFNTFVGCDDYDTLQAYLNGRSAASAPSSRLAFPTLTGDSFPAKLSALLAYSNGVTGAGDVRLGDAIRTLCEGYGGGETDIVFYDRLIGDGKAYIQTDFIPAIGDDITFELKVMTGLNYLPRIVGSGSGTYQLNITGSYFRYFTDSSVSSAFSLNVNYQLHFLPDGTLEKKNLATGQSAIVTGLVDKVKGPTNGVLYLFRNATQGASGSMEFRNVLIKRNDAVVLDLRPCTYEGTPGMWDMVSNTFLGNAGTTGSFTVAND